MLFCIKNTLTKLKKSCLHQEYYTKLKKSCFVSRTLWQNQRNLVLYQEHSNKTKEILFCIKNTLTKLKISCFVSRALRHIRCDTEWCSCALLLSNSLSKLCYLQAAFLLWVSRGKGRVWHAILYVMLILHGKQWC